jgi:hypothetical protein
MKPFKIYLALAGLAALLMALAPVGALAQTSTPTPTLTPTSTPSPTATALEQGQTENTGECSPTDNYFWGFDTAADVEAWTPGSGLSTSWLNSKQLRWFPDNIGYGVMQASGTGVASKSVYLYPGTYRLVYRAGVDPWFFSNANITWWKKYMSGVYQGISSHDHTDYFEEIGFIFQVETLGNYWIGVGDMMDGRTRYYDYACLKLFNGVPTPTPQNCGGLPNCLPSPTPYTQTPTAYPSPSTPIPVAAWLCSSDVIHDATATPRPYTTTVTATPPPAGLAMAVLEDFEYGINADGFSVIGNGFGESAGMDANPGPNGGNNSYGIPYEDNGSSPAATLNSAIVFENQGLAEGVWMDVWASADIVPIGGSAILHVWLKDEDDGQWYEVKTQYISAQHWYPVQIRPGQIITVPSGNISAVALTASRSDNPSGGWIYVDNWYLYNRTEYTPPCDGTYPFEALPITSGGGIPWPADKPCPPSNINQGNNFWGPLLTQFQFWMYNIFRDADFHTPGAWVAWGKLAIIEPIISILVYLGVLFDLSYVMLFVGLAMGVVIITLIILGWKALKRTFNPLN